MSIDASSTVGGTVSEQDPTPTWPLHDQLVKLQSHNPEEIVGLTRMGVGLSFSGAELQVAEIASMLNDVRLDWPWLSPTRQGQINAHVDQIVSTVDQMLAMDSSHVNTGDPSSTGNAEQVRQHRDGLIRQLTDTLSWFHENVRPVTVTVQRESRPRTWLGRSPRRSRNLT